MSKIANNLLWSLMCPPDLLELQPAALCHSEVEQVHCSTTWKFSWLLSRKWCRWLIQPQWWRRRMVKCFFPNTQRPKPTWRVLVLWQTHWWQWSGPGQAGLSVWLFWFYLGKRWEAPVSKMTPSPPPRRNLSQAAPIAMGPEAVCSNSFWPCTEWQVAKQTAG